MTRAVTIALLLLAAPAAAQTVDQGTFRVSVDGHEVGT
jgi:hypothetical protein